MILSAFELPSRSPHFLAEGRLHLLDLRHLVALGDELVDPDLEGALRDADHPHVDAVRQLQIEELVAQSSVVLK